MGILRGIAALLIEEHRARPFAGRLLQLGRQEIFFTADDLDRLLRAGGLTPPPGTGPETIADRHRELTDQEFFRVFGFDTIAAADYSDFDAAELVYDMNRDDLPAEQRGAWDVVIDGGTMEHVFHAPNFLKNVHALLRPGGRVVHVTPASNAVDHGFYSFSPCLFHGFYRANGWRLEACQLLDFGSRLRRIRMTAYDYRQPIPRDALDGKLRGTVHYSYVVATKLPGSTGDQVPQQSFYQDLWDGAAAGGASGGARPRASLLGAAKALIKRHPALERGARRYGLPLIRVARILQARRRLGKVGRRIAG